MVTAFDFIGELTIFLHRRKCKKRGTPAALRNQSGFGLIITDTNACIFASTLFLFTELCGHWITAYGQLTELTTSMATAAIIRAKIYAMLAFL